jgi:hypothetical protein
MPTRDCIGKKLSLVIVVVAAVVVGATVRSDGEEGEGEAWLSSSSTLEAGA